VLCVTPRSQLFDDERSVAEGGRTFSGGIGGCSECGGGGGAAACTLEARRRGI
jgi:hypothetical protein